jgi:hypothetical protein
MDVFEFYSMDILYHLCPMRGGANVPTVMAEGMGKDIWTLSPTQITNVVKVRSAFLAYYQHYPDENTQYTWVTQVFYIPAIILTKMAIVLFYLKVFPGTGFRQLCLGTLVWCMLFMVSTMITEILSCIPVPFAWSRWSGVGTGLCYDNTRCVSPLLCSSLHDHSQLTVHVPASGGHIRR